MSNRARLLVTHAGPHTSYQDGGRHGSMRFGVPSSGPVDRLAHAAGNLSIGNRSDATSIEVARAGLTIECREGAVTLAVTGADVTVDHDGERSSGWTARSLRSGQRLKITLGESGSWAYVAFAGAIDTPRWLGSASTHSMSGFGGGIVQIGQEVVVDAADVRLEREGEIPRPDASRPVGEASVVLGPQDHHFADAAIATFSSTAYRLTDAFDRMGVRLDGPALALRDALSIPSEPIVRGSVQIAGDGVPTVLLADHQTTGGYPKIATVLSCDIDRLSQLRPGDDVRFNVVTADEAIAVVRRERARTVEYLARVSGAGRSLTHRLRAWNLVGGVSSTDDTDGIEASD